MRIKILPYTTPTYCTYNYMGAFEVCGQNYPQINEWILNNYILWKYIIDESKMFIIKSGVFDDVPFIHHRQMWKKHIRDFYVEIFKALLDDNFYVFYTNADDYYISSRPAYKKYHFPHDGIIHGYNDFKKTYYMSAYDNTWHYRAFEVPMCEFDLAWKSEYNRTEYECEGEGVIIGLKLIPEVSYEADLEMILKGLKQYLNSDIIDTKNMSVAFGANVYSAIDKHIESVIEGKNSLKDKRLFKIINEHKFSMLRRFEFLYRKSIISQQMVDDYKKVYELSETTRLLHLKYSLNNNRKVLYSIKENLDRMGEKEIELLRKIK